MATRPAEHFAQALAINASGHSAGYACTTVTAGNCVDTEAVLWAPGGRRRRLDDVGGAGDSEALAINKSDYTVGWSATATGKDAVRWSPIGTATVLQGLKGSTVSEAVAENNSGQSIGYSDTAKGDEAILWGPKGGIAAVLKDPGGQGVEFALALNDNGQSVGYADIAGRRDRGGAVAGVGEGDEPRWATGARLEQYRSRRDQQSGRHYRVWRLPERNC